MFTKDVLDSPTDFIQATVQLEQAQDSGGRTVGTGFLLSVPGADGPPGTVLVTANHVFARMAGAEAKIGYRTAGPDGRWRYTPAALPIRDSAGQPLWTRHPEQDIAVMRIVAPPEYARAAIPSNYLAVEGAPAESNLSPGDELLVLGFPRGVAANNAGFPILRAGRVASYPVSPQVSATFLLDFSVFPGNSGGPVFVTRGLQRASARGSQPSIAGLLTQQVELNDERLEIGVVVHAKYIAETLDLVEGVRRPRAAPAPADTLPGAEPVAHGPDRRSVWERSVQAVRRRIAHVVRGLTDRLLAWLDPSADRPAGERATQVA